MRLQIASDVHCEFWQRRGMEVAPGFPLIPAEEGVDALLLAGDVIVMQEPLMIWLRDYLNRLPYPVFYVLGNHEYYGNEFTETRLRAKEFFKGSNVTILDNEVIELGKGRLIGATLWTDYTASAAASIEAAMVNADMALNDSRMIRTKDDVFTSELAAQEHQTARAFIESELDKRHDGVNIVMTHHAPSITYGAHPDYGRNYLTGAFCTELHDLFDRVDLWIWGHTHYCQDVQVGRTRLVSNQRGYPNESIHGFESIKIIEI